MAVVWNCGDGFWVVVGGGCGNSVLSGLGEGRGRILGGFLEGLGGGLFGGSDVIF